MNSEQLLRMRKNKMAPRLHYPLKFKELISETKMQWLRDTLISDCDLCGGNGIQAEDSEDGYIVNCDCRYRWQYETGLLISNIPARYYDIELYNLDPVWVESNPVIPLRMNHMLDHFDEYKMSGQGFHFVGSPGTGKTSAVCGLGKALLTQGVTVYYSTLRAIINRCFKEFKEIVPPVLERLVSGVDLLILDEVDKVGNLENITISGIIDEYFGIRYNSRSPVIIISKDEKLEFEDHLTDRFKESVEVLHVTLAESYRETLAKRRTKGSG